MLTIPVNIPQNPYEVIIQKAGLSNLGQHLIKLNLGKKLLVISNPEIFSLWGKPVVDSLTATGFEVFTLLMPPGETAKTLESLQQIYDAALENYLERSSTMLALGGGVIGDLTGFAAATWLRGINFIQVPTSLLAMIDASIGGKTGVNHPKGKNLIGAFYQPRLVFIDPQVLATLPEREFRAGMAEVIKYGIIWDADLFTKLEQSADLSKLSSITSELLQTIITRSCQAKVDVVTKDEKESNLRAILNYGHTIGHAVESLTNYSSYNHGEAVAIGMGIAGKIALHQGLWSEAEAIRQDQLIQKAGLPSQIPDNLDTEAIIETLKSDKKVKSGKVRFILPTQIGVATISDQVTSDLLRQIL